MTDNIESLVLEQLRRLHQRFDNLEQDVQELKTRATPLDEHMSGIFIAVSGINTRMDRLDGRVACIERRLDLTDAE
jgi:uncharacterized protein YoxC